MSFCRIVALSLLFPCFVSAQQFSVDSIMREPRDWIGVEPVPVGWTHDGEALLFNWNPVGSKRDTLWGLQLGSSHPTIASDSLADARYPVVDNNPNTEHALRWYNNELFLQHRQSGDVEHIIATGKSLSGFLRSGDTIVTFFDGTSLWRWANGALREEYRFTTEQEQEESREAYSSEPDKRWLQHQQELLFEHVRNDVEEQEYQHGKREQLRQQSGPVNIFVSSIPNQAWLSTDQQFVLFRSYEDSPGERAWVADFVTRSGFTERLTSLPKSVSARGSYSTNVFLTKQDTTIAITGEELPGFADPAEYARDYAAMDSSYIIEEPHATTFTIAFSPQGNQVALALRSSNDNHRWITTLDPNTGALNLLDHQVDSAWIDGPEIGWYGGEIGWTESQEHVWYVSEQSGFAQVYTSHVPSGEQQQRTHVQGMVHSVQYHNGAWYGTASGAHPGVLNAFTVEDNDFQWLTNVSEGAVSRITVSPDHSHIALQYSTSQLPWNLYVVQRDSLPISAFDSPVVQAYNRDFHNVETYKPIVRTIKNASGQDVWIRLYKPDSANFNGKGVVFIHGAGYLQNAHTWWSSYFREFFFHQLLRERGFTVIDVDYRGSRGYGRDWRGAVYRHMGGADLADVEAGRNFLVDSLNVLSDKVGVYGGSYGGFLTLMAMFQQEPLFQAGAALRSVTDWAHYHPWYTRPRLNSPQDDSLAYYRSSPINYAHNLKGSLLMCHGMVDVNVQFSDIVRLSQRLIELNKDNWELAVYPVEGHAFRAPSSWRDEYSRILKLFLNM